MLSIILSIVNFYKIKINKMKKFLSIVLVSFLSLSAFAGNSDRLGESGAPELIMNGWARSTGMWDLNTSRVMGLDAMRLNPAGLSFVHKMHVALAHTQWWMGSGVSLNQLGFASKLGEDNVVGVSLMQLDPGDIYRTTVDNPDPDNSLGSFRPSYFNIGLTFSRSFSSRIKGGATFRLISESIESVNAFGFAIDAGLQYILGNKENVRFGVSVRNIGTPMKFRGDGFSFRGQTEDKDDYLIPLQPGTNSFQLPSLLTLGASYDIWLGNEYLCNDGYNIHRLTFVGSYVSNSMGNDNFGLGLEYAFKEMFMLRTGYRYESGYFNPDVPTTFNSGFSAGFSVDVPVNIGRPKLGLDYSWRHTQTLAGTHSLGLSFKIGNPDNPCLSTRDKVAEEQKDAFKEEVKEEKKKEKKKKKKKDVEPEEVQEAVINIDTTKFVERISLLESQIANYKNQIENLKKSNKLEVEKAVEKEREILESISAAVNFELESADLTLSSKHVLDLLVVFLEKKKNYNITIDAFTDQTGSKEFNLDLSNKRAKSVKDYLVSKGLASSKLISKGHGESETFDNSTREGREKNRRVEISIK